MDYDQFIAKLDQQLQNIECTIWRDLEFSPARHVSILATRIMWSIVRVPVHLCVSYTPEPTREDFLTFFEEGLLYSKRAFSGKMGAKVLCSSFAIIPCLVCDVATPETIKFVSKHHFLLPQHLKYWYHGLVFYPVLYCLKSNKMYSWDGYNFVGSAVWPFARTFVAESIGATATIIAL
jgi:hypothetical protein